MTLFQLVALPGVHFPNNGTLTPAWIRDYMPSKMWDKTVEAWEWPSNFIPHYDGCVFLSVLALKLIHVSKRGTRKEQCT